jgi:hypothetical protein
LVRDVLDGEESRGAEPIGDGCGGCYWKPGGEHGGARDIGLPWGEDVTYADIFDEGGVDI